jgi:sterol desaturase/sphingolipid hydroxylase (fatty acid hydroxylase superfamily)
MLINKVRLKVRADLESPAELRRFGTGWISGVAALVAGIAGLFFVLCLRYPAILAVPQVRAFYSTTAFRLGLHFLLIGAFALSIISLILRSSKVLGFTAISIVLLATVLGGSHVESRAGELTGGLYLGLDWFILNVIFTGFLFIPIERLFARHKDQPLFRTEWREDLFYYLVSSLLVQVLTFISMAPAVAILTNTHWDHLRAWVGSQWLIVQIIEIMFLTDLVQYWLHRAFHKFPFLWGFHAVHHSAQTMDWMAGARMHFFEIIVLRGCTVIPMFIFGYSQGAMHAYILLVYLQSTFVHANIGWQFNRIGKFIVTPRFHHWHHGIDAEATDVNFAIHFPLFDRLFGTYHLPKSEWPSGYGIAGHPVPRSYWKQFWYPLRKTKNANVERPTSNVEL